MYKFHRAGQGILPKDYEEVYLCELFEMPYISGGLVDQPAWWVERMKIWLNQKNKASMDKQKENPTNA